MGSNMAMKLVSFLVVFAIITSVVVECHRHHHPGPWRLGRQADAVVSQDGSGTHSRIADALSASVGREGGRFTIYVKKGIYNEYLVISPNMVNVRLIGEGRGVTIISGRRGADPSTGNFQLSNAATVVISGKGFMARDITFQNNAGNHAYQAPAIKVNASRSAFYKCNFEGHQDTVYVQSGQQFFKECQVSGTVDFICGGGTAIFQDSDIVARKSFTGNQITIATSYRLDYNSPAAIVFHNCRITAAPDLSAELDNYKIYLGRPWRPFARTVYMQTSIEVPLNPEGWLKWSGSEEEKENVVYREYNNTGIGAATGGRVRWPGVRVINSQQEAEKFMVANLIQGNEWLPGMQMPFQAGL